MFDVWRHFHIGAFSFIRSNSSSENPFQPVGKNFNSISKGTRTHDQIYMYAMLMCSVLYGWVSLDDNVIAQTFQALLPLFLSLSFLSRRLFFYSHHEIIIAHTKLSFPMLESQAFSHSIHFIRRKSTYTRYLNKKEYFVKSFLSRSQLIPFMIFNTVHSVRMELSPVKDNA